MENETENLIKEQFAKLPPEIRQAVASFDWESKVQEIGQKNSLHVDKLATLQDEIFLVIIGLVYPDDFINQIKSRLGLPDDKIKTIVNDSNEMIFRPIREALVKIYDEEFKDANLETTEEEMSTVDSVHEETRPADAQGYGMAREDLLRAIENPPRTESIKIVSDKMAGNFSLPKVETDYSIMKPAAAPGSGEAKEETANAPKIDPYRERPI